MANCSIRIELADGVDHVAPGGELDVIVHVSCDGTIKCKNLTLTRFWRTHGRGNRNSGKKEARSLFQGTWEAGEHAYPTRVAFPDEPASYHGKAVNVDWYLRANADVAFKLDPKDERLVLVANTNAPRLHDPPEVWAPRPVTLKGGMMGCMVPSIVALMIAVSLFVFAQLWLPAAALAALSVWGMYRSRQAKIAAARIGHVALEVHPAAVAPGETLRALLEIRPEVPTEFSSIRMVLESKESATSGSGSNETTHTETPVSIEKELAKNLRLDGLSTFEEVCTFDLPVLTPPTFSASDNQLTTTLTVYLQAAGHRELHHSHEITVRFRPVASDEVLERER